MRWLQISVRIRIWNLQFLSEVLEMPRVSEWVPNNAHMCLCLLVCVRDDCTVNNGRLTEFIIEHLCLLEIILNFYITMLACHKRGIYQVTFIVV